MPNDSKRILILGNKRREVNKNEVLNDNLIGLSGNVSGTCLKINGRKGNRWDAVKQDQPRAEMTETGGACVVLDEIGHVWVARGAYSYAAYACIFHDEKLKQ